jgi:O-antigen/teichoic acid export membrane protein
LTSGTALLARAVQVGTSLITIPLTIHYLGNEEFGIWVTISSLLAMATFADFGIGNGVLNIVAYADGQDDRDSIRRAISSGFVVLSAVALVVLGFFAITINWLSWADILHVTSAGARSETAPSILVFAVCFALNIPLDLVQRAQLGLQEGFRSNLWQLLGSIMALAGVIAGIHLRISLPALIAVLAGAPVLATALNTLQFFVFGRPDLRPRLSLVSKSNIRRILSFGTLFFVLQLVVAVSFSADSFIIARVLGVAQVPGYSIPQRMFSLISMMVAILVTPLWPAYAEAISRGDIPWVRKTLARSLTFVFVLTCAASVVLLLMARLILAWWIGPQFSVPFVLLVGLSLWSIVESCGAANAMFMNGANIVRFQIIVGSIFGVACVTAKVYATKRFGIQAVPWATLFTYIPIVAVPCVFYVPRALRRLHTGELPVRVATPVE